MVRVDPSVIYWCPYLRRLDIKPDTHRHRAKASVRTPRKWPFASQGERPQRTLNLLITLDAGLPKLWETKFAVKSVIVSFDHPSKRIHTTTHLYLVKKKKVQWENNNSTCYAGLCIFHILSFLCKYSIWTENERKKRKNKT